MRQRAPNGSVRVRLASSIVKLTEVHGVAGLNMTNIARFARCPVSTPYKFWNSIEQAVAEVAALEATALAQSTRKHFAKRRVMDPLERLLVAADFVVALAVSRPGGAMLVLSVGALTGLDRVNSSGAIFGDEFGDLFRELGYEIALARQRRDVAPWLGWSVAAAASGFLQQAVRQREGLDQQELASRARATLTAIVAGMVGAAR